MLRSSICTAGTLLICSSAMAQEMDSARTLIRPITGNIHERAMRLDTQTGQLQRLPENTINNEGKSTVYDNTCWTGYFYGLSSAPQTGGTGPLAFGDWGALPSTAFGGTVSCTPGSDDTYEITQFVIAYCTSSGTAVDMVLHFWDRDATGGTGLNACDGVQLIGETVPPVVATAASITLTGLPRRAIVSPLACYVIQLTLGTPGFDIDGGAAGLTDFAMMGDRFAWSMQVTNTTGGDGPMLAGLFGSGSPCTFCAGTIWEVGGPNPSGIGLGQANITWFDSYGGGSPPTNNCSWFGGNPWAGAYLILNAHKPGSAAASFCDGTDGSLASCPCGNAGTADSGCDNAQATGGVMITAVAQVTSPSNNATLQGSGFSTMGAPTAILLRSNALDPGAPVVFGDGLRCVNSSPLVRLAATVALGGVSTHPIGHGAMAGTGDFFYQIWYRNTPSTFCDAFAAFNLSNGTVLTW